MRGHLSERAITELLNVSYGLGYRRCLEMIFKNPAVRVLIASAVADKEVRELLRKQLEQHSTEALKGFDEGGHAPGRFWSVQNP